MKQLQRTLLVAVGLAMAALAPSANAGWGSSGGSYGSYGGYGSSGGYASGGTVAYYGSYGSHGVGPIRRFFAHVGNHIRAHHARHHGWHGGSSGGYVVGYGSSGGSSGYSYGYGSSGGAVYSAGYGSSGGAVYSSGYGSSGGAVYSSGYGSSGGAVYSSGYGSSGGAVYSSNYGSSNAVYSGGSVGSVAYSSHSDGLSSGLVSNVVGSGIAYNTVSVAQPQREMTATASRTSSDEIHLTVSLPEDAKVFVNGNPTTSTGSIRHYISRGVEANNTYRFEVRAELQRDGKTVTETKSLVLAGGQTEQMHFALVPKEEAVETALTLRVPEGAKVVLAGNETKTDGELRTYRTKGLKAGESWDDYSIVVTHNGKTKQQVIRLLAGDQLELSFDFSSDMEAKNTLAAN